MIHLASDLRYLKFVHNIAPNFWFIHNINDDSWVINKLEISLTDDAGVIIYNHHMFIVQATDGGTCHIQKQACSVEYTFFSVLGKTI